VSDEAEMVAIWNNEEFSVWDSCRAVFSLLEGDN
jgi:hypothetical protein